MPLPLSPSVREKLKNLLICFSLGNLCLIRRWYDLEHLQARSMNYYRTGPADPTLLIATVLSGTILAVVFWLLWLLARDTTNPRLQIMARGGFLAVLIFPLESVRRYWIIQVGHVDMVSNTTLLAIEMTLVVGMIMAFSGNLRILRAARRVALMMVFLLPALLIDFGLSYANRQPVAAFLPKPSLPALPTRPGSSTKPAPRLVWVVFDELDQRLAFEERPAALEMPQMDRLLTESLSATHATQTAGWTVLAIPSLISGQIFDRAEMQDASTLTVHAEGTGVETSWRNEPNVFSRARQLGANAALVGWHHPYCRILGDSLVRCLDVPSGHPTDALLRETHAADDGVWKTVAFLFRLQVENLLDMFRSESTQVSENLKNEYVQQRQQRQYFKIRDRAYSDAIDPQVDFLYVHFPAPHMFAIYDRRRKDFTLSDHLDYFDNVALVDRTVGELRHKLEQAGLWESTSLLITSDHGFRPDMWRGQLNWTAEIEGLTAKGQSPIVPLILKLAGQHEALVYDRPFSNVVAGDLGLATLSGEVTTPGQASAWLAAHTVPVNVSAAALGK